MSARYGLTITVSFVVLFSAADRVVAQDDVYVPPDLLRDPVAFLQMKTRCADVIVRGVVSGVNDRIHVSKRYFTFVTLEVDSLLKGELADPKLTFFFWGGAGDSTVWVHDHQTAFAPGRKVLVFLNEIPFDDDLSQGVERPRYVLRGDKDHFDVEGGEVYGGAKPAAEVVNGKPTLVPGKQGDVLFSEGFLMKQISEYVQSMAPEALAAQSDVVVVGRVAGKTPEDDKRGAACDTIRFAVDKVLKGSNVGASCLIKARGYKWPGECYHDRPQFRVGDRMVVCLKTTGDGYYLPAGGAGSAKALASEAEEARVISRISKALE
jgi:hypothetical protein